MEIHTNTSEIILYQTEDGKTKIDVRLIENSVWLSLNELAELYQRDKSVISRYIKQDSSNKCNFWTI